MSTIVDEVAADVIFLMPGMGVVEYTGDVFERGGWDEMSAGFLVPLREERCRSVGIFI